MSYPNVSKGQANANAYLRTRVMSATPEELRLMLLEGAARFARQGRDGLLAKDHEASFEGFSSCRNIIIELLTTMNPEAAPELCDRVRSLYTFIYTELVTASFQKDVDRANKVIELIDYEVETWKQLMAKLSEEQPAGGTASATPHEGQPRLSLRG